MTNAITVLGEYVKDSFDRYKIQTILRELERDFGLQEITSSWEIKHQKAQGMHLNTDIARLVANSLQDCPNLQTWLDRLAESDIDVRFNIGNNDCIKGVTFLKDDKDGQWEPVGFPHVEKRDVEQLERFNGMESKKFETPIEYEALDIADEFIKVAAYVVSDLEREQDEYFEEEGLSF